MSSFYLMPLTSETGFLNFQHPRSGLPWQLGLKQTLIFPMSGLIGVLSGYKQTFFPLLGFLFSTLFGLDLVILKPCFVYWFETQVQFLSEYLLL
jgi:hypothetical protein